MRLLFVCGGTAGHINPALSIAGEVRRRFPNAAILFAGSPRGMEARLVPQAGFEFTPCDAMGFWRGATLRCLRHNLRAACMLVTSAGRTRRVIEDFEPHVVVGTGGYVSGALLRKAHQLGCPTVTHEQNAYPGVTTRLLCSSVDKVLLAVPAAQARLPEGREYVVTGNPVRPEILSADRVRARERLGVGGKLCILSFGGSLGAQPINRAVAELAAWMAPRRGMALIHASGQGDWTAFGGWLKEAGCPTPPPAHLDLRPYIDDMADCLAAADLVICRAGAITLSELQAVGRPAILIPSPYVTENHQYHNAMQMVNANAAVMLEEKDLSGPALIKMAEQLIGDPQRLAAMGRCARRLAIPDANRRIVAEILELLPKAE